MALTHAEKEAFRVAIACSIALGTIAAALLVYLPKRYIRKRVGKNRPLQDYVWQRFKGRVQFNDEDVKLKFVSRSIWNDIFIFLGIGTISSMFLIYSYMHIAIGKDYHIIGIIFFSLMVYPLSTSLGRKYIQSHFLLLAVISSRLYIYRTFPKEELFHYSFQQIKKIEEIFCPRFPAPPQVHIYTTEGRFPIMFAKFNLADDLRRLCIQRVEPQ